MDSRLPVDHAALRCAEYACTSAVISVYPADTTSERNRFWSQIPPDDDHGGEREPDPGDRYDVVVEQRAGDGDADHELDDHATESNVPLNAILSPVQATMTAARPAQSWSPEGVHVGRGAADHGVEHDIQEALEVLELVIGDLRRDIRVDRLRGHKLHGEALPSGSSCPSRTTGS